MAPTQRLARASIIILWCLDAFCWAAVVVVALFFFLQELYVVADINLITNGRTLADLLSRPNSNYACFATTTTMLCEQ